MNFEIGPRKFAVLLLAAGASRRLGKPKQLLSFEGVSLVKRTAELALALNSSGVFIITGSNAEAVSKELNGLPIQCIHNENWNFGIGQSISVGIKSIENDHNIDGVLILVCDQPYLDLDVLEMICNAAENHDYGIIASHYGNQPGVPVYFKKRYFKALQSLSKDFGAKKIILQNFHDLELISFPRGTIDIDTPEDCQNL